MSPTDSGCQKMAVGKPMIQQLTSEVYDAMTRAWLITRLPTARHFVGVLKPQFVSPALIRAKY